jgi:hypothetical protein
MTERSFTSQMENSNDSTNSGGKPKNDKLYETEAKSFQISPRPMFGTGTDVPSDSDPNVTPEQIEQAIRDFMKATSAQIRDALMEVPQTSLKDEQV